MTKGRQADSARRRQRVIAAISKASADGTEISVSAIARAAAVDPTFLYRHRDLLAQIHAIEAAPPPAGETTGPAVTRASLQTDLLAAHERTARLHARIQQLEKRLSEALGEHVGVVFGTDFTGGADERGQVLAHHRGRLHVLDPLAHLVDRHAGRNQQQQAAPGEQCDLFSFCHLATRFHSPGRSQPVRTRRPAGGRTESKRPLRTLRPFLYAR